MEAARFNEIYDDLVAGPVVSAGGWQQGRRLFYRDDDITAAVLRVERRWRPPPELLLVVRHRCLRSFDDEAEGDPPTNPNEYPIKMPPSSAAALSEPKWQYEPHNLGRWPSEVIEYRTVSEEELRERLEPLGILLAGVLPQLSSVVSPRRLLERLESDGEDAWCEQRWIADLRLAVSGGE